MRLSAGVSNDLPLLTDAEGDPITISSDEELLEALDQFDGTIFKIHLKSKSRVIKRKSVTIIFYSRAREKLCLYLPPSSATCVWRVTT